MQAYYKSFSASQILVLSFEKDIVENSSLGLKKVCDFLEIDNSFQFKNKQQKNNDFGKRRVGTALACHLPIAKELLSWSNQNHPVLIHGLDKLPIMGKRLEKVYPSEFAISELYKMYAPDNDKLFDLLGYRIESWQR